MAREKYSQMVNLDEPTVARLVMSEIGRRKGWHKITIDPKRPTRSLQQNAFFWGVLVETFVATYREQNVHYSKELVSKLFKVKAGGLTVEEYDPLTGELLDEDFLSTADYSVPEMSDFIDRVMAYLLTDHRIVVPDACGLSRPEPQGAR